MTHCELSPAFIEAAAQLVEAHLNDPTRPRLAPKVAANYTDYIHRLAEDPEVPLLVRSGKPEEKGTWFMREGRKIIYVDNGPPQWMWRYAEEHPEGSYDDLRAALINYQIPAALALSSVAKKHPNFTGMPTLSRKTDINSFGYELAHIKPVRLEGKFRTARLQAFKDHFRRLMSVNNMLLVPKNTGLNGLVDWYYNARVLKG